MACQNFDLSWNHADALFACLGLSVYKTGLMLRLLRLLSVLATASFALATTCYWKTLCFGNSYQSCNKGIRSRDFLFLKNYSG